mgnify:CR=1 FL=1
MSILRPARLALTTATVVLAALLAACQEAPPPAAPPPVVVAPPPPPPIGLANEVTEQAAAYQGYMARAMAVSPAFRNGDEIQDAVRLGAAYEPQQRMGGAIAYAAVVALQDPAFVSGVRTYVTDPAQRRQVAAAIMADPAYVVGIKGSDSAAGMITDALTTQGFKVYNAGRAAKIAAYDIQRQNWSKAQVIDQPGRLARAKLLSTQAIRGTTDDAARLQLASTGATPLGLTPRTSKPPYSPLVIRGLAVAALAALGEAGDQRIESIRPLLNDGNTGRCLSMSKLNLYQCLAVAKPHYEDVFCLGQHILMETGQCMIKAAGGPTPIEIYPRDFDVKTAIAAAKKPLMKASTPKRKAPAKKG